METSRKIDDMQVMASPTVAVASAPQSQIRIGPSGGFTPSSPERNLEDGEVAVPFPASAAGRQIVGSPASPRERKLAPKPHFKKKNHRHMPQPQIAAKEQLQAQLLSRRERPNDTSGFRANMKPS